MAEDWDDLRIFLAVARRESLTAAGRVLRVDPATVGRRVARLEETMGTPLFSRSPQGYALTSAGQRLLDHLAAAEHSIHAARAEIGAEAGRLTGQVRVGAPDGCANYLLPQVCAALCDRNPGLEVQIVALPRIFNLSKREADMLVSVSRPTAGRLTVQKITDYRLHLAASRDYLARHPPIASLADLTAHRVIGYIPDMIMDRELDYLHEIGATQAGLASNSVPVQLQWVRQGAGVAVVHDFALPFAPGVVRILPDTVALTRAFYLVRPADDRRAERLNIFAEALATGLRREVQRLEALET